MLIIVIVMIIIIKKSPYSGDYFYVFLYKIRIVYSNFVLFLNSLVF